MKNELVGVSTMKAAANNADSSVLVNALKRLMDASLTAGLPRTSPAFEAAAVAAEAGSFTGSEVSSTQLLDDILWVHDIVEGYDHIGTGSGKGADKAHRKTVEAWARIRAVISGVASVDPQATRIADAIEACDWSGSSIGNKEILKAAVMHLRTSISHEPVTDTPVIDVDELAQEIRRVDGSHSLGAGALAEALMPFLERAHKRRAA